MIISYQCFLYDLHSLYFFCVNFYDGELLLFSCRLLSSFCCCYHSVSILILTILQNIYFFVFENICSSIKNVYICPLMTNILKKSISLDNSYCLRYFLKTHKNIYISVCSFVKVKLIIKNLVRRYQWRKYSFKCDSFK